MKMTKKIYFNTNLCLSSMFNQNNIINNLSHKNYNENSIKKDKHLKQSFSHIKKINLFEKIFPSYSNSNITKNIMLYPKIHYKKKQLKNKILESPNISKEFLQTSIGNFKLNYNYNYENNKSDSEPIKRHKKLILLPKTVSKSSRINQIKKDIFNIETPEDFHIFNVNIMQMKKNLVYKFDNIKDDNNLGIIKIGDEF